MSPARVEAPSQHMGSVHKDSLCRMPQVLTPPWHHRERNVTQYGASRSRENRLGMPLLHRTATRCNTLDQTENDGVPGSNPGAVTPKDLANDAKLSGPCNCVGTL
jgi:hypothetical protein